MMKEVKKQSNKSGDWKRSKRNLQRNRSLKRQLVQTFVGLSPFERRNPAATKRNNELAIARSQWGCSEPRGRLGGQPLCRTFEPKKHPQNIEHIKAHDRIPTEIEAASSQSFHACQTAWDGLQEEGGRKVGGRGWKKRWVRAGEWIRGRERARERWYSSSHKEQFKEMIA